eukprot:1664954-Amphidinium_carterae.1
MIYSIEKNFTQQNSVHNVSGSLNLKYQIQNVLKLGFSQCGGLRRKGCPFAVVAQTFGPIMKKYVDSTTTEDSRQVSRRIRESPQLLSA